MALSKQDRDEIIEIIDSKFGSLSIIVNEHMKEVKPFLDGWRGARTIGNFIKWTAGVLIAIGAVVAIVTNVR